jgi:hypothetical protein
MQKKSACLQALPTPEEAASALAASVKSGIPEEMLRVLGSGGADIIESGDDVADGEVRWRAREGDRNHHRGQGECFQ